ncbi:MAG: hypothetical protein ABI330_07730 [Caldimonas sp.]|nr:hypothetical protein [Pseudomonadota bacterium]
MLEAINKLGAVKKTLAGKLDSQLQAALDEKDAGKRDALAAQAKTTAAELKKYLQSDAVASNIDGNELHPGMKVIGPFMASLDEVARALG